MRRLILLFLLPATVCVLRAQSIDYPVITETAKTIEDFVPKGWRIFDTASGDLNKDKLADVAFVIESNRASVDVRFDDDESAEEPEGPPRILVVLFKQKKGGYKRSVQTNTFVLRSNEGGVLGDPWAGIEVDRGSLVVHFYGGSNWRWGLDYRFRFQDKGWYLIGATNLGYYTSTGEMETYDFNLLTGEVEITKGNAFGEECRRCDDCEECHPCERCGECEQCVEVKDEIAKKKIGKKPLRKLESYTPMNWEIMPDLFI